MFYLKEMKIAKTTFTHQFTYAVVYAWLKLREQVCISLEFHPQALFRQLIVRQEIRNITWIAECIAQNQKGRIGNYISVL